ncbi:geranylgeranyl pyrophosphate synthase [Aquibacillus albus]|uniref:Geranylgeranyl pyrophosphate synthase n=1 Tax=Aquibacillus albus TaxID=1168171 RepID=A0ABS2N695_9BACI|nr:geranylgeranyl pyrophosphate synthase [Aquibacillus albus]
MKRFKEKKGTNTYKEVMELFASGIPAFNRVIHTLVKKTDDVDFFDKLLRDQMIAELKKERKEQDAILDTVETARSEINDVLKVEKNVHDPLMTEPITDAANYSLAGDGKRLRPVMAWIMGVNGYGLDRSAIVPLLRSLEYMHTASLIFDDLPSQDNASLRRGKTTVHQVYNVAIAEITGLFLTQKAVEEQASLNTFDTKTVLQVIQYSAQKTTDLCKGQVMDLDNKGKPLTLEQLRAISHKKTGIALEASLLMPAILANASELERKVLKKFAYHAGIMFQVKDDLLDVEGDQIKLGKAIGKDADNNNSTFVSVLGTDGAREEMWDHYCHALEAIQQTPHHTIVLKHLLNYMIHRDH